MTLEPDLSESESKSSLTNAIDDCRKRISRFWNRSLRSDGALHRALLCDDWPGQILRRVCRRSCRRLWISSCFFYHWSCRPAAPWIARGNFRVNPPWRSIQRKADATPRPHHRICRWIAESGSKQKRIAARPARGISVRPSGFCVRHAALPSSGAACLAAKLRTRKNLCP